MLKSYKYRLYPTPDQKVFMEKHFGACRFIYNLGLETKKSAYLGSKTNLTYNKLAGQMVELKKELTWLKEVSSQSLQASLRNLDCAYNKFFNGLCNFPKFKTKYGRQTFKYTQKVSIDFENSTIKFPKFKAPVNVVFHKIFSGAVKTTTIIKTPTGKYFVSILVDNGEKLPSKKPIQADSTIGIDLGLKSFIVTSDGDIVDNPRYLRGSLERLRVLHRRVSKKKLGSANRKKANMRLSILYEKIVNRRKDFLHKLSTKLVSDNQTICLEDLEVRNMIKNRRLSLSMSDSGWAQFVSMLRYKCEWSGKNFVQIGRFEPSTKLCSSCQVKNDTLTLADREWVCANCGTLHNRDINAAKNIKYIGLKSPRGTRVEPVELPTFVGAVKQECEELFTKKHFATP